MRGGETLDWISHYLPQLIYWAVTGALAAVCGAMGRQISKARKENEKTRKENEAQRRLLMALAKNNLYRVSELRRGQGYCTMSDKRDIESIYEPYKELGGNGTGKVAFESVMELPNEPPERKE